MAYTLPLQCTVATATVTRAAADDSGPTVEEVDTTDCEVHLELDSVPVFVEIAP